MAYPTSQTTFTDPLSSDPLNLPSHSALHTSMNDTVEAIQAQIGYTNAFLFALLTGQAGGQILKGGTASGDDLTLQSTSHATRGYINFGSGGTTLYDEVNDMLQLGGATTAGGQKLEALFTDTGITATKQLADFEYILNPASTSGSIYRGLNFTVKTTDGATIGYNNTITGALGLVQHRADSNVLGNVKGGDFSVITGPASGAQDDNARLAKVTAGSFVATANSNAVGSQTTWVGGEFTSQIKNYTKTTNVLGAIFGCGMNVGAAGGQTVTMTIASPCVVTLTNHGLAANRAFQFTTTGALPTGLSVSTTYYVKSPGTNTFNVSATPGGAAINTSGTQSGVHTLTPTDPTVTNMEAARFGLQNLAGTYLVDTSVAFTIDNATMVRVKPWITGPTYTNLPEQLTLEDSGLGYMGIRQQGTTEYNYFAGKTTFGVDATQSGGSLTNAPTLAMQVQAGAYSGNMDTMTYAAAITLDTTLGNVHKTTTVHATGNATINASDAGVAGQPLWIVIINDATSAKTITFGTNFKSSGTLTASAVSRSTAIHFVSDGTSWYEAGRSINTT